MKNSVFLLFLVMFSMGSFAQQGVNYSSEVNNQKPSSVNFSSESGLQTSDGTAAAYKEALQNCSPGTFDFGFISVTIVGMQTTGCKFTATPMGGGGSMDCTIPQDKLNQMTSQDLGQMVDITPYCSD